jgi:hypothetical protein
MVFHSAFNSILFYWLSIRWYEMKLHSSNANFMQFLLELIFSGVGQRDKVQLPMSWSGAIPQSVGPVISTYKMASEPKFANVKEEYLNRGSDPPMVLLQRDAPLSDTSPPNRICTPTPPLAHVLPQAQGMELASLCDGPVALDERWTPVSRSYQLDLAPSIPRKLTLVSRAQASDADLVQGSM